jgi:hypothetical protein
MTSNDVTDLAATLALTRKQLRLVSLCLAALIILFAAATAWQVRALTRLAHPQSLTLRRLDIVDEHGVSRVILAAPAPAPTLFGKVHHRDGPVSGVLLADATGTERGGYVTSDGDNANALLTLDAQGKQTVLLLAEPGGSTLFRIWNQQKASITMGVNDQPFLNEHQANALVFSAPKDNPQSHDPRPLFQ